MFKAMLNTMTKRGKVDVLIASIFFMLYGLASILMLLVIFAILFKIKGGNTLDTLYIDFGYLIGLVLLKGIFNMIADLEKHYAGFDIVQQIRQKMIVKLKRFSLGFYTKERLGEINIILHKDVDNMSLVVGHMWPRMFGDFGIALTVFIGLSLVDLGLALLMAASIPIAILFLVLTIVYFKKNECENNAALADMVSLFVEYVRGIPVLKNFSNNQSLNDALIKKIKKFGQTSTQVSRYKAKQLAIFSFLLDFGYFILLATGALMTYHGQLSIFNYIIFAVVAKEFYKPFASLEMHYMYFVSATDSYSRLSKILYANSIVDNDEQVNHTQNQICFKNVDFYYEENEFSISHLNFKVAENTTTALVGESGSGKTTIAHLLLRFYDIVSGVIEIGGIDITAMPYDHLLDRISIVMQNVQLFDDTIEENIRLGKKDATKQDIIHACQKARIHDFIMDLPKGYQTNIGEDGGLLSGGQRQRLSIARAFLKDAPILILDEMTSNVDPINEMLIQDAITELAKNRTVLVIAHHLKTIKSADQILVFNKGKLVEQGDHQNLLCKGTFYKKLWTAQYGTNEPLLAR